MKLFLFGKWYLISILALCSNVGSSQNIDVNQKNHTASDNVMVLDTIFKISNLDRERKIRIYLPLGYEDSNKQFPVIYMQDGQNLFDDLTSFVGEWGVDEILNEMALGVIVVGIDNGQEKRVNEMGPWDHPKYGKSETKEYLAFIINQVKPYIDKEFRTLKDREHTSIMGSSLGGLLSHYAVYTHSEVFKNAIVFSPSYWFSDEVYKLTSENTIQKDARIYLIVGSEEGEVMVEGAKRMYDLILANDHPEEHIYFKNVPGGKHSETFWKQEFKSAMQWLFKEN